MTTESPNDQLARYQREIESSLARANAIYRPEGLREQFLVECLARTEWRAEEMRRFTTRYLARDEPAYKRAAFLNECARIQASLERRWNRAHRQLLEAQKARLRKPAPDSPAGDTRRRYVH